MEAAAWQPKALWKHPKNLLEAIIAPQVQTYIANIHVTNFYFFMKKTAEHCAII
jgi:hypothetical protein